MQVKMEMTLAENGLKELDTVYLSVPVAGGMQGARGAHISSLIPFQGAGQEKDEETAQSPNPVLGSLVVHPHSAVSESSIQLLGTGWTRSQTGQLQLLPNPLPAVQIDRALFVMGDLQHKIDAQPAMFNQHASAFLNTMTQQGGEAGAMIIFIAIPPIQFRDFLPGMKKLWEKCGHFLDGCEKSPRNILDKFDNHFWMSKHLHDAWVQLLRICEKIGQLWSNKGMNGFKSILCCIRNGWNFSKRIW